MNAEQMKAEIERLHEASFSWAIGCCGHDRFLAEDVLQQVYIKILSGRARFDGRSSFKTWIFAVVRLTAHEHRRKSTRRARLLSGWFEREAILPGVEADQLDHVHREEEGARVRAALERLSERQREVLELVFYHELTLEEASEVLDMRIGTARTHYARGKKNMLAALSEDQHFVWEPT